MRFVYRTYVFVNNEPRENLFSSLMEMRVKKINQKIIDNNFSYLNWLLVEIGYKKIRKKKPNDYFFLLAVNSKIYSYHLQLNVLNKQWKKSESYLFDLIDRKKK